MYGLEVASAPEYESDVLTKLCTRESLPVEDTLLLVYAFEMTHGRFNFVASHIGN